MIQDEAATKGARLDSRQIRGPGAVNARLLRTSIEAVESLRADTAAQMFDLYESYYDAVTWSLFESDLREKNFAVILRDEVNALVGFSTLTVLDTAIGQAPVRAIYSGDTIIDRAYWGTQALAFSWIRFAGSIKAKNPEMPLYWFLIVKGHRTYRYLPTFAIEFYPHWDKSTPAWAREIMDGLARQRFAERYDPCRGIISFPQSRGHLNARWAAVDAGEARRKDVSFFLLRNPDYGRGDELVCLTELSSANLRPLARRVFEQGLHP